MGGKATLDKRMLPACITRSFVLAHWKPAPPQANRSCTHGYALNPDIGEHKSDRDVSICYQVCTVQTLISRHSHGL